MSETKFTPGPWKTVDHDWFGVNVWNVSGNKCIAERCRADDARLIAAAPDMYEALKSMIEKACKQNWDDNYPEQLKRAFSAIAKAEGKV